jgi:cyclopropane-fatty-acyl-phospholipid synthase
MPADILIERRSVVASPLQRALSRLASRIALGRATIHWPDGTRQIFSGAAPGPEAELRILRPRVLRRLLLGGHMGLAESFIDGDWESPDLARLIELGARNEPCMGGALQGRTWSKALHRLVHALRRNSRRGARRNIAAHYDLGNDFYAAWLDPAINYSSGIFRDRGDDLAQSQINKYRAIAAQAGLRPGDRVLEIGCGWGGFAIWAARELGCHVTAVTISRRQYDHAAERVRAEGLSERVTLRLQDYRDVTGQFDRIVSIEMLEAVGEAYWPTYFDRVRHLLRPGGRAAIQVITIADDNFEAYRRDVDFIQRYIFPGGMLPSPARLRAVVAAAGLTWEGADSYGPHYARTLAIWHDRFVKAWPGIRGRGFDERFGRMWRYYLAYCEAGFRAGRVDVLQIGLSRDAG